MLLNRKICWEKDVRGRKSSLHESLYLGSFPRLRPLFTSSFLSFIENRGNSGAVDSLITIISLLPWWVYVLCLSACDKQTDRQSWREARTAYVVHHANNNNISLTVNGPVRHKDTNTLTENLFRTRQFSITADNYAEDVTTGGDSELRHTLKHRQQRAGDKKDRRRKYRNAHTHRHTHWSEDRHVYMSGALNVISVSDLNLLWFKKVNKRDHRIKTLVFIEFQVEMNGKYIFIFKMYFTEQRLYCWIWQQKKSKD